MATGSTRLSMNRFAASESTVEARVRAKTYGLVTLEQMKAAQEGTDEVLEVCSFTNSVACRTFIIRARTEKRKKKS